METFYIERAMGLWKAGILQWKPHTSARAQMLMKYDWPEHNAASGDVKHECDRKHLLGYLIPGKGGRLNWITQARRAKSKDAVC